MSNQKKRQRPVLRDNDFKNSGLNNSIHRMANHVATEWLSIPGIRVADLFYAPICDIAQFEMAKVLKYAIENMIAANRSILSEKDITTATKTNMSMYDQFPRTRCAEVSNDDNKNNPIYPDCHFFAKQPFYRLAVQLAQQHVADIKFGKKAMLLLQQYIEYFFLTRIKLSILAALHERRTTLLPRDLELVLEILDHCN